MKPLIFLGCLVGVVVAIMAAAENADARQDQARAAWLKEHGCRLTLVDEQRGVTEYACNDGLIYRK